jgi:hypothetical protein
LARTSKFEMLIELTLSTKILTEPQIAAEALFQSGNNYQLAMRASYFGNNNSLHRKEIFELYREVSRYRNDIVHGKFVNMGGKQIDILKKYEEHLYISLHKFVEFYSNCSQDEKYDFESNFFL